MEASPGGRPLLAVGRRKLPPGQAGGVFDLADASAVCEFIASSKPAAIVHCAALADVDRCEQDRAAAYRNNVVATRNLVEAAAWGAEGCRFIYISTDQVYPGPGPASPGQEMPVNFYGWSKLWGEDIALRLAGALVLRLNYVGIGTERRQGLASWLTHSLRAGTPVTLFEDVLFNPCHGSEVPRVVAAALDLKGSGVFNLGAAGHGCSKAEFLLGLTARLGLSTAKVRIGRLADAKLVAPRPLDMRMDISSTEKMLRRPLPDLERTLDLLAAEWSTQTQEAAREQ